MIVISTTPTAKTAATTTTERVNSTSRGIPCTHKSEHRYEVLEAALKTQTRCAGPTSRVRKRWCPLVPTTHGARPAIGSVGVIGPEVPLTRLVSMVHVMPFGARDALHLVES